MCNGTCKEHNRLCALHAFHDTSTKCKCTRCLYDGASTQGLVTVTQDFITRMQTGPTIPSLLIYLLERSLEHRALLGEIAAAGCDFAPHSTCGGTCFSCKAKAVLP